MKNPDRHLFIHWILNCALGELIGIGAAGAIAVGTTVLMGEPESLSEKFVVLFLMMLAGALEGTVLGYFQWRILVRKFHSLPKKTFMAWTISVAVSGWFLGMLPSLFFIPENAQAAEAPVPEIHPLLFIALSMGMGLILGALFGLFQFFALRKYATPANRWILANALGWALGMCCIFIFATLPDENTPRYLIIGGGILGGLLAGISVGLITGIFLRQLKPVSE
ncbi:MAG: hypothetical protein HYZ14_03580 [Bacteroidetes bacterium]|nr:hypothetical protein [Bacteroidota bacterium]